MHAIEATGLWKTYGKGETEVTALRDVSLRVRGGEVAALLGPSGSGKSTLLTTLGLLLTPDRGQLSLGGEQVVADGRITRDAARLRRERIGFVFQKANLIPFLTALENVLLALEINGLRGREAQARARELLDYLGLGERTAHLPDELSGGQQQRVAIARALAMNPPLVLADEPTAALDSHRSRDVMQLFRRVAHERGTAVVVVTHDHRTLDAFDTVHEMEDGVLRTAPRVPAPSPA
ncbi:ABC transporter ATP-binding protein [Myxococcus sp. RHSTA-1-4]|uniref:ABC transporter ATP-binding protein n=1 Tax=Myxococcus sp. RHSTA-1-4 TaxID=2874601 RepID=UPI001CC14114|nr:ABC transporter ATP-binding protein [Myxococcus sp. RHSTA-1-4]MBZ4421748.1 ABC transporter ATP-binding protein [Myxococcus sp. RHSTA-1-4]